MAAGHDRELLRRLDAHRERLERVEDVVSAPNGAVDVRVGRFRAAIQGASAHTILMIICLILILAGLTGACVMLYAHVNDARAGQEAFVGAVRETNREFVTAIKELTNVQREGNCLMRTKGVDPNLCRDLMR